MVRYVDLVPASLNKWMLALIRAFMVFSSNDDEVSKLPSIGPFIVSRFAIAALRDYPGRSIESNPITSRFYCLPQHE
jgi:hypothetical protein